MDPNRTLIVYYSRTGTTRELARAIRDELGCDIDRIADRAKRRGAMGWLRSFVDATLQRSIPLQTMSTLASDYDLLIVGTPIWSGAAATPVQTYLRANRDRIRRVAFFCTSKGVGGARAMRQMSSLCALAPVATLDATTDEIRTGHLGPKVHAFVSALTSRRIEAAPPAPLRTMPA